MKDVAFFQEGPGLRNWQWRSEGMKVINVTNIRKDGSIDVGNTDRYIDLNEFDQKYSHFAVQDGDIVVASSGNSYGKVGRIRVEHLPLMMNTSVIRFRTHDPSLLDDDFLFSWLRSNEFRSQVESYVTGGAQPNFGPTHLKKMRISLPDIRTQERITAILSTYDGLIENNRRRIALLEEAARMLYREWFVHFRFPGHEHVKVTNGLPEGWERRNFGDVCIAIGGGTPSTRKSEFWNEGDIPWYTPTDITRNSCQALLDSATKITEAGLRGSSAKLLPAGTVLMTSRASVGFFGIIGAPSCTNQGFISIQPNESAARMYLLHNLMHRVEEIRSHAGGSTYKEISKGKFKALPVVMPDAMLLREFEEQVSNQHAQVRTLHAMNQKLAQARDLLLPRLMSGEIPV